MNREFLASIISVLLIALVPMFSKQQLMRGAVHQTKYTKLALHEEERQFLLGYLKRTRMMTHDAVSGVTPAQWTFKPKPFRWSVAECAEHIILAEHWLMNEFENKFAKGNEPAYIFHWLKPKPRMEDFKILPPDERRIFDLRILNSMLDRSQVDTSIPSDPPPEVSIVPKMKYKTPEEMLVDFDQTRDRTIRIIEELKVDLRQYYIYPNTTKSLLDGYQYLLRIPSHNERHLMQLQEVKGDPNYPH